MADDDHGGAHLDEKPIFTVGEGAKRGLTPSELRSNDYLAPTRGTRAAKAAVESMTWSEVLRDAHAAAAADGQFFSHTTAARIHGMPLPSRLRDEIKVHVAAPEGANRTRRPTAIGHRLRAETVVVNGYRVETVIDTVIHLATLLTFEELVRIVDWALSPRCRQSITKESLVDRLQHFKGARGIPRLRRAIAAARARSESPMESDLRIIVVEGGFAEPLLNIDVFDAEGTFVARIDMAWPHLKIALEYDGDHHRTDPAQHAKDTVRIEALQLLGWIVIRVTKEHMRDPERQILPRLRAAFDMRLATV